jgi:hypothetical protein
MKHRGQLAASYRNDIRAATYIKSRILSEHPLEADTDAFNNPKEDSAYDGRISCSLVSASNRQRTTREEARDN